MGLHDNLDVRLAEEKIDEVRSSSERAHRAFFPTFDIDSSYTHLGKPPTYGGVPAGPQDSGDVSLTLTQPLYMGGKLVSGMQLVETLVRQAEANLVVARRTSVYNTRQAFYSAILAQENKSIAEDGLRQGEANLGVVEAFFQSGRASRFDLLRARVQVANLKSAVIDAENQLKLAKESLMMVIGASSPDIEVEGTLTYEPIQVSMAEALSTALANRKDLQSLRMQQEMASLYVQLEQANLRPMLNLFGGYGYSYSGDTGSWDDNWSVTVALTLTLYDFGKIQASVSEKESQAQQVGLLVSQLEDGIRLEVRKAFWDMQTAEKVLEAQQLNVEQAREAVSIATYRYANGTITQTELMDVQLALRQAELGYTGALYSHTVAKAALARAMGVDSD